MGSPYTGTLNTAGVYKFQDFLSASKVSQIDSAECFKCEITRT